MAINTHSFCTYYCGSFSPKPSQETYAALKFVKALKGDPISGWADVLIHNGMKWTWERLEDSNKADAVGWAGAILASRLKADSGGLLVPIPGHSAVSELHVRSGVTYQIAAEIVRLRPRVTLAPLIWFDQVMPKARGGPLAARDPYMLHGHMVVSANVAQFKNATVILIDDVVTTGAHLQAAALALKDHQIAASNAFVVGRRRDVEEPKPFSWVIEAITDA